MSAKLYTATVEQEDFFTRLSFSALMCELGDKENIMMDNMQLPAKPTRNVAKLDREVERWLGAKTDRELINIILM